MRYFTLCFVFLLFACQTTGGSTIGSGPITLSPRIQQYFDNYKADNGMLFSVAVDGKSGLYYFYCPDIACREMPGARQTTIDRCEKNSNGVPCKIYALRDEIVWDFGGLDRARFGSGKTDVRSIDVLWLGREETNTTIDVGSDPAPLTLSGNVDCEMSFDFSSSSAGTWTMECSDDQSAEGTFAGLDNGNGTAGVGVDRYGNDIEFRIGSGSSDS